MDRINKIGEGERASVRHEIRDEGKGKFRTEDCRGRKSFWRGKTGYEGNAVSDARPPVRAEGLRENPDNK